MKTMIVVACVCAFLPGVVAAQSAPDRRGDVETITRLHPTMFGNDDTRREGLKIIACTLNLQDGGNWGRLVKLDQGGKIPADILVWRPTREHFDVLTDTGPFWGPDGVLNNAQWQWSAVECAAPVPVPPAPTPTPTPTPTPPPASINIDYSPLLLEILNSQRLLVDTQKELLGVAANTNVHVVNMDRTLSQTLGSISLFAAKYIAPAVAGFVIHQQIAKTPADAPAK